VIYQIRSRHRRSLDSLFRHLTCTARSVLLLLYSLG
jgi:hypothetical protein